MCQVSRRDRQLGKMVSTEVYPHVFLSISSPVRGIVAPPTPLLTPANQLSLLLPLNKAVPQSAEFAGPRGNTGQSASFLTGSCLPRPQDWPHTALSCFKIFCLSLAFWSLNMIWLGVVVLGTCHLFWKVLSHYYFKFCSVSLFLVF